MSQFEDSTKVQFQIDQSQHFDRPWLIPLGHTQSLVFEQARMSANKEEMMLKRPLAIIALLGLSLVSAQSNNPKGDQISYIAQMQAALEASLAMHLQNIPEDAKRLIGSASGKRWDRVKADLSNEDQKAFEDGFKALSASIDTKEPTDKYKTLIENIDQKMNSLIGATLTAKDAAVALDRLLIDTAFYYGRGVEGGKIVAPRTYILASMFVPEALEIAKKANLGAEVQTVLVTLEQRTKGLNSDEINTLATQARQTVSKATGVPAMTLSNQFFLDKTRNGLVKADAEYSAGKVNQAVKTIAELYLDGFEYLEIPLIAKNPEMKDAIEKIVGGTIPQAIKAGKPASEVSKQIGDAQLEINKAALLLGLK
jgi:hypothetical protein